MARNNPLVVKVTKQPACPFIYYNLSDMKCCTVASKKTFKECVGFQPGCPLVDNVSVIVKHVEK